MIHVLIFTQIGLSFATVFIVLGIMRMADRSHRWWTTMSELYFALVRTIIQAQEANNGSQMIADELLRGQEILQEMLTEEDARHIRSRMRSPRAGRFHRHPDELAARRSGRNTTAKEPDNLGDSAHE